MTDTDEADNEQSSSSAADKLVFSLSLSASLSLPLSSSVSVSLLLCLSVCSLLFLHLSVSIPVSLCLGCSPWPHSLTNVSLKLTAIIIVKNHESKSKRAYSSCVHVLMYVCVTHVVTQREALIDFRMYCHHVPFMLFLARRLHLLGTGAVEVTSALVSLLHQP